MVDRRSGAEWGERAGEGRTDVTVLTPPGGSGPAPAPDRGGGWCIAVLS